MNASVINRFAKIVTAGSAKGRYRRLALTLPLAAAVVAAGAVGCTSDTTTQAAPTTVPTLSTPAGTPTPTTTAPTATATPAPTTTPAAAPAPSTGSPAAPAAATGAPVAAKTPAATPLRTTPVLKAGSGVAIRFDGLVKGRHIEAGGGAVAFSVTWTNTDTKRFDTVIPVVAAHFFDGAQCSLPARTADGTIERKDGNTWTSFPVSQGTDVGYASQGEKVAFGLAPGASRTFQFRLRLDAGNNPGTLGVEAEAVSSVAGFVKIGRGDTVDTTVTDSHRPKATVLDAPGTFTAGGRATEFKVRVGNPTRSAFRLAVPTVVLPAINRGAESTRDRAGLPDGALPVLVEAQDHGRWRSLPTRFDCNGELSVDTTGLGNALAAGGTADYTFRITLPRPLAGDSFKVRFGASADQHRAPGAEVAPEYAG
ncbi:hypothetical protein [Kitasatospora indigofera]|uniref:hypothetical protein n=1 Tax=Kitasatospora indigofera TaxID=67307 RepID=UPI0033AC930D